MLRVNELSHVDKEIVLNCIVRASATAGMPVMQFMTHMQSFQIIRDAKTQSVCTLGEPEDDVFEHTSDRNVGGVLQRIQDYTMTQYDDNSTMHIDFYTKDICVIFKVMRSVSES